MFCTLIFPVLLLKWRYYRWSITEISGPRLCYSHYFDISRFYYTGVCYGWSFI